MLRRHIVWRVDSSTLPDANRIMTIWEARPVNLLISDWVWVSVRPPLENRDPRASMAEISSGSLGPSEATEDR
jgi:hypothetical protein